MARTGTAQSGMAGFTEIECAHCGKRSMKRSGAVNRARKIGAPLYCDKICSGLARRQPPKSDTEKKALKAAYDTDYRAKNKGLLAAKKRVHHQKTHDPERQRAYNAAHMAHHVEYCRRPEYRAYKREYDREYRARQDFGEFWESALLILDIRAKAIEVAGGAYELALMKGTLNKAKQRRRDYERLEREEPEDLALGNLERGERW